MLDTYLKNSMHQWLDLDSCWSIDHVETNVKKGRVDIYISHSGKDLVCPDTGESGTLYDHRKKRQWRHLDLFHLKCFIHCRLPRVLTPNGPKTITIPWAAPSSRVTYAFESFAIRLLKATKTKTADLLRCGFNQLNRIMHRAVERGESRRSLAGIHPISLDEKALKRGHTYATIVSDSDRGVVIDLGQGRTKKGTIELLECILEDIKDQIETVSTDMWKAFIGAVAKVFPHALMIHDRFHCIQYLNKAINQVRRREVKQHPELKGSRYALLKNENNRTKKQEDIFQVVKESNLNVSVAWRLREDFKAIFECSSLKEAKAYFNLWLDEVNEAGVKEVMKIADMFKNHFDGVCNALWNRQSNAKAERINGKIQEIKTIGRGYRTFENFRVAILFFCGGLDLYPHDS